MRRRCVLPGLVLLLIVLLALLPAPGLQAAPRGHEHGIARLSVALDGGRLFIEFDAPLDDLLGFERAPRTDAERAAVAALRARLADGTKLFVLASAAGCKPGPVTVDAPALEAGAKTRGGHGDLQAGFVFDCAQPQALRAIDLLLFETFARLQRIEVQLASPQGQSGLQLKRPARRIQLLK